MAVTKIWAIHDSVSRVVDYSTNPSKTKLSDLEQVLLYAADKEKTLDEGEQQYAVTGIGCRAESAAREMAAVQRRFGKAGGNVAYHAHQSFKTGEVTAEECHRIGVETARRLWGNDRQVLVATHFNTGTYHNHFVVNPVNMWTGKKLEAKYEVYYKLRDMSDRVCKEHGLSVVKNPQRHKTARSVYFAEKDGEPTRYNLMRRALDEALTISSSWTELSAVLRKKGYVFVCDPYRRYATIRSLSAKKCMRTFRLGAEYDKEALQDRLLENQRDIRVTRRYFEFMRPYTREYARKNPPTEKYYRQRDFYLHLPRVTGYLSFFRCVAIVLGVAPLYEKEYRQPLSAECREACRRLDRFTAEITLVCREHLDTPEDVQRFLARMDKEMDAISAARSKIRNKQRGCADPVERVELKKSCAACTAELSRLRKQKQTAYNMIEDMELWLGVVRNSIEKTTFSSYTQMVKGKIAPYFRKTGIKLGELQARHIQSFYLYELKTVSASTVIHEHANIHKALKYAVKMDLIPYNPADKVERPKKQKYIADYYRLEELEQLFEATKDHPYSLLIQITAFYGLRRSEALGLRWDAIDFERNTITIRHIVTNAKIDGKYEIVREDRAKTKSSLRSLPLVDNIREKLLALKEQQKENKRICGNCYNREYDGYVFVDVMGNIFNPRNLSSNFSKLLELKGLRHIRFHDLRHSCASLLLANDVPMKQIQEWLGHSDISTTANIYSHLDYKSKLTSANVMDNVLTLPETEAVGWQT